VASWLALLVVGVSAVAAAIGAATWCLCRRARDDRFWCAIRRVSPLPVAGLGTEWLEARARWVDRRLVLGGGRGERFAAGLPVSMLVADRVVLRREDIGGERLVAVLEAILPSGALVLIAANPGELRRVVGPWVVTPRTAAAPGLSRGAPVPRRSPSGS
jgi:hypothetical protein